MTHTILIVDDDDLNREVMKAFLSLDKYTVWVAGNGHKALEITHSKLPDLVILDVRLPDINGLDVCQSLKSNPNTHNIPVMIITGLSDKNIRQQAESAGADLFLPRPFEADDFINHVRSLLPKSS